MKQCTVKIPVLLLSNIQRDGSVASRKRGSSLCTWQVLLLYQPLDLLLSVRSSVLLPVPYPLRARWHIRPRRSASTCPCRAQLSSLLPMCSILLLFFLSLQCVAMLSLFDHVSFYLLGTMPVPFTQSFSLSCLKMCPMFRHLLCIKSPLILSNPALSKTSSLLMWSCNLIFKILCRHLWWKVSTFFSSPLFIFHVSAPYINTALTYDLYSLSLVFLLMLFKHHTFFNLINAVFAFVIRLFRSTVLPPSFDTNAPTYSKFSTSWIYIINLDLFLNSSVHP